MIISTLIKISFLTLAIIISMTIALKLNKRFKTNFDKYTKGETKFNLKHVALAALAMPVVLWAVINMPENFIVYFYVFGMAYVLGTCFFLISGKWYTALLGLVYPMLYFYYWNIYFFNIIAILIASFGILFMLQIMSWKIVKYFTVLFVILDIIMVLYTKMMVVAATKIMDNNIPAMIMLPANEVTTTGVALGLGDIFLTGLLCATFIRESNITENVGIKFSWMTAIIIGMLLFISSILLPSTALPATVHVIIGFLISYSVYKLQYVRNFINKEVKTWV